MGCNCDKVLFSGSLDATQTVGQGLPIGFTRNLSSGCSFTDTSITLTKPGVYLVNVCASAASASSSGSDVKIELRRNGEAVHNVQSASTSSDTADIQTVSLTSLVRVDATRCRVNDQSATMTVVNVGEPAIYSSITITIARV